MTSNDNAPRPLPRIGECPYCTARYTDGSAYANCPWGHQGDHAAQHAAAYVPINQCGIKRVSMYIASPVQSCDRCSAAIKYVSLVEYRDGITARYGSECINKILADAPDMLKLYNKNAKLLRKYQDALEVFSRKPEDMPRGSEYFNSGLYFIADSTGKDIMGGSRGGHWFFHPLFDADKNHSGSNYVVRESAESYAAKQMKEIEADKPWFVSEIARIETFLARVMAKAEASALAKNAASPKSVL